MSEVKRCVQCGILKEHEAFRKYTYSRANETEGRYRICKSCEAINVTYHRAKAFVDANSMLTILESNTLLYQKYCGIVQKTEQLYNTLEARGLRTPRTVEIKPEEPVTDLDKLIAFYESPTAATLPILSDKPTEIPDELNQWLTIDTQEWKDNNISPEYLQETVYESLKAKYRPQIDVDHTTFLPIYDDTFKKTLNDILRRFDDYEEECSLSE